MPARIIASARGLAFGLVLVLTACTTSPSPIPQNPVQTNTITLTSAGADIRNVEVPLGGRLLFINNDSRSHNMTSDPHPEHDACPELNQVGFLKPGESRETGNMVEARTCGFHDHDDPDVATLKIRVVIK